MNKNSPPVYRVSLEQLQPGIYIQIERPWFKHPFLFGKFKICSWKQIEKMQNSGISSVLCIPAKSDVLPQVLDIVKARPESKPKPVPKEEIAKQEKFEQGLEKLEKKKTSLKRCEARYDKTLHRVSNVLRTIASGSQQSVQEADEIVTEMVKLFLEDTDAIVHLMNSREKDDGQYSHALNVTVLALMLGRDINLDRIDLKFLGMGCMFHDVGKNKIEPKLLKKPLDKMSKPELQLIRMHPQYGLDIVAKSGFFPQEAAEVILQHHERLDGSGYPNRLGADKISMLVRIAAIANTYDNLCNPSDLNKALTPYQALSYMYAQKSYWDMNLFTSFVRRLGIYPPGTVVTLSNKTVGMVVSVNSVKPTMPDIIIYRPGIPKKENPIFSLEDYPEVKITNSLHPAKLPPKIYRYLSPRERINYFMQSSGELGVKR